MVVVKPEKQRYPASSSIWNHFFPINFSEISNKAISGKFWIVSHFKRFDLLLFVCRRCCDTELRKWSLIIRCDITIGMNLVRIVDKYVIRPCLGLSTVEISEISISFEKTTNFSLFGMFRIWVNLSFVVDKLCRKWYFYGLQKIFQSKWLEKLQ